MKSDTDSRPLACVVLAAGQGTRMKSGLPKVMHPLAGMPMIRHVVAACEELSPEKIVVVVAPGMKDVEAAVAPVPCAIQARPLGTGDAVKAARNQLQGFEGDIVVVFGDAALIRSESLKKMRERRTETNASIIVGGFLPSDPLPYGRLILDKNGKLHAIIESKETTPEQRSVKLCNGGIMLFDAESLWPLLDMLDSKNAKNEFYLTDCVKLAREANLDCAVVEMPNEDVLGINTRVELAEAEALMQRRLRERAMLNGATLIDPATVYLSVDTKIGRDVIIGPNVVMGSGVEIGDNVEIRAFCHLEQAKVEKGALVGPFARLRAGAVIGADAHIGNFVEIKKSVVGKGAKINHLSYIGDASVGAKTNIGAGTITCNYDGYVKSQTVIGEGAFIGSNTALVAPVLVGDGAIVGAGSVITTNVPADSLTVGRAKQVSYKDWAKRRREAQKNK